MQKAKQQGHARASSYPSSLPRYLTMGAAAAAGGGEGGRRGHTHRDSEVGVPCVCWCVLACGGLQLFRPYQTLA